MGAFVGYPQDDYDFYADEIGAALAGLVVRDAAGVPRTGVLRVGALVSGVAGAWQLRVEPFPFVSSAGAQLRISGIDEAEFVDVMPAPASGARIDVVCWSPSTAQLVYLPGDPASSPVPPIVPGGLAILADWRTEAGQINAAQGTVTHRFRHSAVMGQQLVVRSKTELDGFAATEGVQARCLADGFVYERLNGGWVGGRVNLAWAAQIKAYSTGGLPRLTVSDGQVVLRGIGTTNGSPALTGNDPVAFTSTIPEALRPDEDQHTVQQGSQRSRWLLTVRANGTVSASRYGPDALPTQPWLVFKDSWPLIRKG